MKVSEYLSEFLLKNGVTKCFSVTGGFAMHMNDCFGKDLSVMYTHGEAPAGYAAIGYSSVYHEPSVCCVTSGCGATNAVTPCMIAYQDSVPVFFISGQVHRDVNIRMFQSRGLSIRGYFGSDVDIISMVSSITKYSHELWNPEDLPRVLDECLFHLTSGRLGPVWLSIPVDVQAMQVQTEVTVIPRSVKTSCFLSDSFTKIWTDAKRPLVLAGNGIHVSHCVDEFNSFLSHQGVPSVVSFFGIDLNDTYIGKVGLIGNRAGNFAIQNCDVLLCLGCRLSKSITGYNRDLFAPDAKILYVDIDDSEFLKEKRTTINIPMNLKDFFKQTLPVPDTDPEWIKRTQEWREKWSCELPSESPENPYPITKRFFEEKPPGCISVASSGSLYCLTWHMYKQKAGDRFITSGHGDMGYELPVAIGAAIHGKTVYSFVGDGSFQLNLQELQTLKTSGLPVVVLYYNNGGYGAIQITQKTVFGREYGTSPLCGLECPDIEKIARAYGIQYHLYSEVTDWSQIKGPSIVEIRCCVQERFPKISNKAMPDGTFANLPYQDMAPFLDRDVLEENMFKV